MGTPVWAKHDLPTEQRVPESFLFGPKKTLCTWGYTNEEVYVDKVYQSLKVAGEVIVTANVRNGRFVTDWAKEWSEWSEFATSAEISALSAKATDILNRAATKGKGKGKKGPRAE